MHFFSVLQKMKPKSIFIKQLGSYVLILPTNQSELMIAVAKKSSFVVNNESKWKKKVIDKIIPATNGILRNKCIDYR